MTDFLNQVAVPGVVSGATSALFALAFVVMYRTTGVLNFAHGQLVMLFPLIILVVGQLWAQPLALAVAAAVAVLVLAVLVEERLAIRPFMQSGHALPWILSTLGFSVVIAELMAVPFHGEPVRFPWGPSAEAYEVGGIHVSAADGITVLAPMVIAFGLVIFDRRTAAGVRLRAISQDKDGAAAIGISPAAASRLAAIIAGVIAAVTGFVLSSTQLVTPELGLTFLFNGFVAAAVGGLRSIPGALVGGLVAGLLGQAAAVYVGGAYVQIALFSVLLLVYLVRPYGIFGRAELRAV